MRPIIRGLAALTATLAIAACGGTTTGPTSGPGATIPVASPAAQICTDPGDAATVVEATVGGNEWGPVAAKVNDVITWTNGDAVPHRVALDDGRCGLMPNIAGGGGQQSLTFTEAGSFPFHCGVHPSMKGTIVIT